MNYRHHDLSFGSLLTLSIVILVLGAGFWYLTKQAVAPQTPRKDDVATPQPNQPTPQPRQETYSNAKYAISLTYPDIYVLEERDMEGSGEREHHIVTLMRRADLPPPQGGEGPPAITIEMFQNNLDKHTSEEWIRNDSRSNFKLSPEGRLASTTISGSPALSYRWDGLYNGTTIAQARQNWVYAFSVTYLAPGDPIVQDFVRVRDSVRITDTPVVSANTPQQ